MNKTNKLFAGIIITLLAIIMVVAVQPAKVESIQKANPQFVIASWDFPDEYGQGIEGFEIFENSTGSWVQVGGYHPYDEAQIYDWNVSVAIKLICYTFFNSTLTGASTSAEGKNYQRHNVTVTDLADVIVFSQQNFTYVSVDTGIDPPLWFYGYSVILNFLPTYGEVYTVTVSYEIYYL